MVDRRAALATRPTHLLIHTCIYNCVHVREALRIFIFLFNILNAGEVLHTSTHQHPSQNSTIVQSNLKLVYTVTWHTVVQAPPDNGLKKWTMSQNTKQHIPFHNSSPNSGDMWSSHALSIAPYPHSSGQNTSGTSDRYSSFNRGRSPDFASVYTQ